MFTWFVAKDAISIMLDISERGSALNNLNFVEYCILDFRLQEITKKQSNSTGTVLRFILIKLSLLICMLNSCYKLTWNLFQALNNWGLALQVLYITTLFILKMFHQFFLFLFLVLVELHDS